MVNESPDDAELEHLLTQLLRMVSPAITGQAAGGTTRVTADPADSLATAELAAADGLPATDVVRPDQAELTDTGAPAGHDGPSAAGGPARAGAPAGDPVHAVSSSEARALIELVSARGIAQGELAALLGLDKSTVSRLAAGLERKGWIRRGRDEGNQRYVRLYLTAQGGEVAARVWQAWQSRQARILAALSADERAGLSAGLGGLVRGLAAEGLLSEPAGNGT
jgi:DNA-binding MarR family transcriptional regulator